MRNIFIILLMCNISLVAEEMQIKTDVFKADQVKGVSTFQGHVTIKKSKDRVHAVKVTIYTNKQNKPTKFIADGNVSFQIETEQKDSYKGKANRVVFIPQKKEYHFYGNVHLQQLNKRKEIKGDQVILNINDGKAYAKGLEKEPVIMTFDIPKKKEK